MENGRRISVIYWDTTSFSNNGLLFHLAKDRNLIGCINEGGSMIKYELLNSTFGKFAQIHYFENRDGISFKPSNHKYEKSFDTYLNQALSVLLKEVLGCLPKEKDTAGFSSPVKPTRQNR